MDENKISLRYAKALFGLAREKNVLDDVRKDIDLIHQTLKAIPEFRMILSSPVVKAKEKAGLFKEAFERTINEMTFSFLNLVLSNKRESYLEGIARNFLDLFRRYTGYKSAVLSSAFDLDSKEVEEFRELIRIKFRTEVDLSMNVNRELIGGFVLRVEDQQIDASVASKLKRLKQNLIKSR